MALDLSSPLVQSVLIPVAGGFALTGAIRFANGRAKGPLVAGSAVALGFLIGYVLIFGWPALPPQAVMEKLAFVVLGGLLLGFLLDFTRRPQFYRELLYMAGMAAALYWVALPRIETGTAWTQVGLVPLWLGAALIGYRIEIGRPAVLDAGMKLLIAALGAGVIATLEDLDAHARLCFALATALGGFMLWNWPIERYPFGAALLLGGVGALAALGYALVLETAASPYALAMLLPCFFADIVSKRVKLPAGRLGEALRPFVLGAVAVIPALAAVAIAYFTAGGGVEVPAPPPPTP
jgi:UDP-N-acetylmuramyl pentapeptide phosphotransferase/UDP-N-acetylglucosamine-1-phosphate transferase